MAAADYRLCDICAGKAFYDASLSDDYTDHIGDWAVLCQSCAATFKVVIVPREAVIDTTASVEASTRIRAESLTRFMAVCEESRKKREAYALSVAAKEPPCPTD